MSTEQPSKQPSVPKPPEDCCQVWLVHKQRYCGWPAKGGGGLCRNHLYHSTNAGQELVTCPYHPLHRVPAGQLSAHLARCPHAKQAARQQAASYYEFEAAAGSEDDPDLDQLQQLQQAVPHVINEGSMSSSARDSKAQPAATAAGAQESPSNGMPTDTSTHSNSSATTTSATTCGSKCRRDPFASGTAAARSRAACAMGPQAFMALVKKVHAAHADLTARFPSRPEVKGSHLADLQQRHREQAQRTQQQQQHEPEKQQAESQRPHHEVGQGARPEHGSQQLAGAQTSTATPAPTYPCGPDATALLQAKMAAIDPLLPFDAKHALQNASIAAHLQDAGMLPPDITLVEAGAGKAWLGAWCCLGHGVRHLVLLDRMAGLQGKADRRLRHLALTRVVGDLAHTLLKPLLHHHAARYAPGGEGVLARQAAAAWKQQQRERWQREQAATPTPPIVATVASTVEGSNAAGDDLPLVAPWVITGKHLCGAATDFTIRAMLAAATPEPVVNAPAADNQGHVRHWCWWGAALAPCCHHRCSWRAYVGKDIMRQAAIAPAEFEIVAWLTGWALCGHDTPMVPPSDSTSCHPATTDETFSGNATRTTCNSGGGWHPVDMFTLPERMALGMMCKQLIDAGRCAWLCTQVGDVPTPNHRGVWCVRQASYVPSTLSGENNLILVHAVHD